MHLRLQGAVADITMSVPDRNVREHMYHTGLQLPQARNGAGGQCTCTTSELHLGSPRLYSYAEPSHSAEVIRLCSVHVPAS